jgi:pimeloyl-ACP methyl ester carboxylesterase
MRSKSGVVPGVSVIESHLSSFGMKLAKYITDRRRAIPILLFALCVLVIGGSFIRMWSDPDFRRSDLPLSTVEDTLSKSLQRDTEIAQVQVQQCRIVYEVGGDGKDVVLLHCWAGSKEYWKWTIQALIPHFRVFALDLKGFGDSDKPKDGYTMQDYSRLLAEFMDTVGIDSAILVGHSLGGKIAVDFAEQYPDRMERLVLVGTPVNKVALGLRVFTWPVIGKPWYWVVKRIGKYTLQTQEAKRAWLKPTTNSAVKSMKAFSRTDLSGKLLHIHVPTLVVVGDKDRSSAAKQASVFVQKLENARLRVVKHAGHSPMCENPAAFNRLLLDFLR